MGSDLNICANIIRVLLVIINILFVILGIILIGIGSWAVSQDSNFSFITGNNILSGAVLLIIAGIVTVIICATGIFGAIFKLRPILVVYALVLLLIVILEIVGGILAFVFRNEVAGGLEDEALQAIALYNANPDARNSTQADATAAIDFFQDTFSCCGYNNFSDWLTANPMAVLEGDMRPPGRGCAVCVPTEDNCVAYSGSVVVGGVSQPLSFNVTSVGCVDLVQESLVVIGSVGGALGVVFGIIEITGIVFALALCCCITSARKQEVV